MNKFTVPDINTDMGRPGAIGFEKYQIASTQISSGNMSNSLILGICHTRQGYTGPAKYIAHKTGTETDNNGKAKLNKSVKTETKINTDEKAIRPMTMREKVEAYTAGKI